MSILNTNLVAALIDRFIPATETVPPDAVCPDCGENRMDELVWNAEENVVCQTCGRVYDPLRD